MGNNELICEVIQEFIRKKIYSIPEEELRFLLEYLRSVKESEFEISPDVNEKTVLEDLKRLNERISEGELTPVSFERLGILMNLFEKLLKGEDLDDISYELDKLYASNDMQVRKNSSLVHRLKYENDMVK